MANIKKILLATDFSPRAMRAARRAAMLCVEQQAEGLELLTVKEAGLPDALAQVTRNTRDNALALLLERSGAELRLLGGQLQDNFGVASTHAVRFGRPEREIAAAAADADLSVIGAHGGNFFTDLFLGNTADKLIHMTTTPLLVVKEEPAHAYREVLVPVDFSEDSNVAARLALQIAPAAQITFLHAFDVEFEGQMHYASVSQDIINAYRVKSAENARQELNQFVAGLDAGERFLSRIVTFGHPGPVIREHAKNMRPDLIVIGKHGRSRMEELLLGSVTRHTLSQTACDILVVPAAAHQPV